MSDDGFWCEVSIEFTVRLEKSDVWPDGDGPAVPTTQDVKALMEACGDCFSVLSEWNLMMEKPLVTLYSPWGGPARPWDPFPKPSVGSAPTDTPGEQQ